MWRALTFFFFFISSPHVWMCHMFITPETDLCEIKTQKNAALVENQREGGDSLLCFPKDRKRRRMGSISGSQAAPSPRWDAHTHTQNSYLCEDPPRHDAFLSPLPKPCEETADLKPDPVLIRTLKHTSKVWKTRLNVPTVQMKYFGTGCVACRGTRSRARAR